MEIWKDIDGYEGIYQVSNLGNVKSKNRTFFRNGKTAIHWIGKPMYQGERSGYKVVYFKKGDSKTSKQVHRLVAQAFIPNPDNKPQVNHKDGNKHNNNADNLEWVTVSENAIHALNTGLRSRIMKTNKKVLQYDLNMNYINEYVSLCDAERKTNVPRANITRCCKGIYKQSGGYIWKYKEREDLM